MSDTCCTRCGGHEWWFLGCKKCDPSPYAEIVALRAGNERLKEALEKIARNDWGAGNMAPVNIARAALGKGDAG
jgi:hypothetical protein